MNIYCKLVMSGIFVMAAGTVNGMDRPVSPHDILSSLAAALDCKESIKNQAQDRMPGRMSPADCKAWKRKMKIAKRQQRKQIDEMVIAPLFRPMSPNVDDNKKN